MKLDTATTEVILSNVGTTGEFKIRNSAKAFSILSSGLYSNKIRAIIRELSCNALDSHAAAGNANVPFEVHLPTMLEPWFSVKDFGQGLDGFQVVNIYTTYFESTKTNSNDFIGALGLGSKSPFSYTDNFTVIAVKAGIKRIYSAFINEAGVPSIAEMSEELTDEPNGVEVKFSVTNTSDYRTFTNEARQVFQWFKDKPAITGVSDFNLTSVAYQEKDIVPGVHLMGTDRRSFALMGNIPYPLDNIPEKEKHFGSLAKLLDCSLVLEFDIGELDFAASREQLSYVPMTLNSIKAKLEILNANLAIHITNKANAIQCEWKRAEFLYNEQRIQLYSAAVKKYVADTKFELYDTTAYHGQKTFILNVADLVKQNLDIVGTHVNTHGRKTIGKVNRRDAKGVYFTCVDIPVDPGVVIVLNDLKTGCVSRARYHYGRVDGQSRAVYCVSHSDPDLAVREKEYNKLIKELHNPPVVVKASTLSKPESKPKVKTTGILRLGTKQTSLVMNLETSYTWYQCDESEFDDSTERYYVCLNGQNSFDKAGASINIKRIKALIHDSGIKELKDIEILGVRKTRMKEISGLKNWIWVEDELKKRVAKISESHVASVIARVTLDDYYKRLYTNKGVAKAVGTNSDYAKYVNEVSKIVRITGEASCLAELCKMFGNAISVDAVKDSIVNNRARILKKYPLLKFFRDDSTCESDAIDYIKLIDTSTKPD